MNSLCRILFFCLVLLLSASRLSAHAFLEHSDPSVGGKVHSAPAAVRIWFTEAIEPAFSSIQVFDPTGKQVDKKDVHLDSGNRSLLEVSLPRLGPGTYKVIWNVMSADSHVTNGDFKFQVAPEWHVNLISTTMPSLLSLGRHVATPWQSSFDFQLE